MTNVRERRLGLADVAKTYGLRRIDHADAFEVMAPVALLGEVEPAARRFLASVPEWTQVLLEVRDDVVQTVRKNAPGQATRDMESRGALAQGQLAGMFHVFAIDETRVVLGGEDRWMAYRLLLDLCPDGRFRCTTLVQHGNAIGRWYFRAGLPFHRWFVRRTLANFARPTTVRDAGSTRTNREKRAA